MRIVYITHYAALLGANRSLLHLIDRMQKHYGVEPLVLCPKEGEFTDALRSKGIPFRIFLFTQWAYTWRNIEFWLYPLRQRHFRKVVFRQIEETVHNFSPDVLHSNSLVVSLGCQLQERLHLPHVWHIREYGWADYRLFFFVPKLHREQMLKSADRVIFISHVLERAHTAYGKLHSQVVYNGIGSKSNMESWNTRPEHVADNKLYTFLIIGLLHPSKGQLQALQAFAALHKTNPNVRLIIAGKGRMLYTLRLKLFALYSGIRDVVQFTGYVNDPHKLYAKVDAVLMCSPSEAMGRVTAEAMAHGKPLVGFNGGATPELVEDGKTGLLYTTTFELIGHMQKLLLQPELGQRLGRAAYDRALELFTDEAYGANIHKVYQSILKKGKV